MSLADGIRQMKKRTKCWAITPSNKSSERPESSLFVRIFRKSNMMKLRLQLFSLAFFSLILAQTVLAGQGQNSNSPQEPQKRNERPAAPVKAQAEPFDGASVEKMAGQCVTLQTEAGAI